MFLTAMAISSLGITLAALLKTMQGFQVLINFILMPMFFLSGALFPLVDLPKWMTYLVIINPLSYGIDATRTIMLGNSYLQLYPLYINIIVLSAIIIVITFIGILLFNKQE